MKDDGFLFSGYARLPQDVSHQALYKRVGVVIEVDEDGIILDASTSLMMDTAREFFAKLIVGRSVLNERPEIEAVRLAASTPILMLTICAHGPSKATFA